MQPYKLGLNTFSFLSCALAGKLLKTNYYNLFIRSLLNDAFLVMKTV
jgi:hypothetical protein